LELSSFLLELETESKSKSFKDLDMRI